MTLTPAQRARRIRQLVAERERVTRRDREIVAELRSLENAHSWSLGFRVPLRGDRLLAEMDRREGRAA